MLETSFKNKKALITGGTKGVGFAIAKSLAQRGVDVYLSYRSDQAAADQAVKVLRHFGVECQAFQCDLAEEEGIQTLFKQLIVCTSNLDIYIHNAAATAFKNLMELQPHHINKTFNISVKSFILGVQNAVPLMKNGGKIVSVSGMDTLRAVPKHGLLGAAKSALETLTAYFAHELASKNIQVNCVNPGFLDTDSTRKYLGAGFDHVQNYFSQTNPLKRMPSLEEISNVILFLCTNEASWVVGQTICVDGGSQFAISF